MITNTRLAEEVPSQLHYSVRVDSVTPVKWAELLGEFDDANIYQTSEYGSVRWGPRQVSHVVLESEGKIVALALLRVVRLPLLRKGVALLRWGPVCRSRGGKTNEADLEAILSALKEEYVRSRGLILRVIPRVFREDPDSEMWRCVLARLELATTARVPVYRSIRLDLSQPLDLMRKTFDQKWRNQLNAAERKGLIVHESKGLDAYKKFLRIYDRMIARKRFDPTVDPREFQQILEILPEALRMQVFICESDGRPVSAAVVSAIGDTGIYLLGATSDEGLQTKGAYLIQWRILNWLHASGCSSYDLGGIDPANNPGVYHFKRGLSGLEVEGLGCYQVGGGVIDSAILRMLGRLRGGRLTRPR